MRVGSRLRRRVWGSWLTADGVGVGTEGGGTEQKEAGEAVRERQENDGKKAQNATKRGGKGEPSQRGGANRKNDGTERGRKRKQ